jgi:hypothetical protein
MILGQDFRIVSDSKEETLPIELLLSPYIGVSYRYTQVGIREVPEDDKAILRFDYVLLDTKEHKEKKLRKDPLFQEYLGLILNSIILSTHDTEDDPNDRTNYAEEL